MNEDWKSFLPHCYKKRGRILLLLKHMEAFMDKANLWPKTRDSFVAVSGGVDSVFLAYCLNILFKKKTIKSNLTVVHINHGTREECESEQELVVALAKTLNLKVSLFKLKMNLNDQNFEKKARDERYKIFHSLAQNKNSVYLGHHIDDSYEWSFMQKHRSSNYKSSLGIPLKNGVFRRPLHCLTKKQILNFAHDLGLNFMHDSSGADSRFDRNFLRNHIIPKLEKRYPHYLKHYVDQANDLARSLKLSSFESSPRPQILIDHCGGLNFLQLENEGHFLGQELFLENTVKHYFKGERKKLRNSLSQVIELQAKGKNGPHKIGNDIDVFCYRGIIQLVDRKARSRYQQWDQSINLDKEFQKLSSNTAFQGPGPYWVLSKSSDNHIMPSLKKDHPLFPNLFRQLKQKKLFLRPYSQLLIKAKKKGLDNWERDFISLM